MDSSLMQWFFVM